VQQFQTPDSYTKQQLHLYLKRIKLKEETSIGVVTKLEHFGRSIRNTWKVLKCGAGEGWKISWTDRVRNEEMLHTVKEERNIIEIKEGRLT